MLINDGFEKMQKNPSALLQRRDLFEVKQSSDYQSLLETQKLTGNLIKLHLHILDKYLSHQTVVLILYVCQNCQHIGTVFESCQAS